MSRLTSWKDFERILFRLWFTCLTRALDLWLFFSCTVPGNLPNWGNPRNRQKLQNSPPGPHPRKHRKIAQNCKNYPKILVCLIFRQFFPVFGGGAREFFVDFPTATSQLLNDTKQGTHVSARNRCHLSNWRFNGNNGPKMALLAEFWHVSCLTDLGVQILQDIAFGRILACVSSSFVFLLKGETIWKGHSLILKCQMLENAPFGPQPKKAPFPG